MVNANISTNHMIATIKECRVYSKADKILTVMKRILEILKIYRRYWKSLNNVLISIQNESTKAFNHLENLYTASSD